MDVFAGPLLETYHSWVWLINNSFNFWLSPNESKLSNFFSFFCGGFTICSLMMWLTSSQGDLMRKIEELIIRCLCQKASTRALLLMCFFFSRNASCQSFSHRWIGSLKESFLRENCLPAFLKSIWIGEEMYFYLL